VRLVKEGQVIKIAQQTVKDQLINKIKEKIINGYWESGRRIPTEHEISELYSVGRGSVREALQHLIAIGLLERDKSNIFVSKDVSEIISEPINLLIGFNKISAHELFETRLVLEVAMAGMAALRRAPDDLEKITLILDEMKKSKSFKSYIAKNIQFHQAVADASKNTLLIKLFNGIQIPLREQQQEVIERGIARRQALDEHKEILQAISEKNKKLAEKLMDQHLKKGLEKYLS
jgi:GntR family transcriptional repressor for pyruvate dehydrogenase complex